MYNVLVLKQALLISIRHLNLLKKHEKFFEYKIR